MKSETAALIGAAILIWWFWKRAHQESAVVTIRDPNTGAEYRAIRLPDGRLLNVGPVELIVEPAPDWPPMED